MSPSPQQSSPHQMLNIQDTNDIRQDGVEDETDVDVDAPILLTNSHTNPLIVNKLDHVLALPEFPETSMTGHAYLIPANGGDPEKGRALMQNIQYGSHQLYRNVSSTSPFLQTSIFRTQSQCTGVKICPYLEPTIRDQHHSKVTDELWNQMKALRSRLEPTEDEKARRMTIGTSFELISILILRMFYGIKKAFSQKTACKDWSATCQPVMKYSQNQTVAGVKHPFIICSNSTTENQPRHFFQSLAFHKAADTDYLNKLFTDPSTPTLEVCAVIEPMSTRRKDCGFPHENGPQPLQFKKCQVHFNILIPKDLTECPYYIFTSHGEHTHPPAPPTKAPIKIISEIKEIIANLKNPDLNLTTFLQTPQLQDLCSRYNATNVAQLHPSFVNMDRFTAIILKERLALYPEGQDLNGLRFEMEQSPPLKEYVRYISHTPDNIMIICGLKTQINLLHSLQSFEVDMSYKRIRAYGLKEVIFAAFLPAHGKIITLLRVLTNQESAENYEMLFKNVFQVIQDVTGKQVTFKYLHGSGFESIIGDMDGGQMEGLGRYLTSIDPEHHRSDWQLRHIMMFCRVHFLRGIDRVIGPNQHGTELFKRMASLLDCPSRGDYYTLIALLMRHETDKVRQWASHKGDPIIASGLNKACSKIEPHIFDQARPHINAGEQSHQKSYMWGKRLSLLKAIQRAQSLDERDEVQYLVRDTLNIRHSYRSTDIHSRYAQSVAREQRKRQRQSSTPSSQLNILAHSLNQSVEVDPGSNMWSSSGSPRSSRSQSPMRGRAMQRARTSSSSSLRHRVSGNIADQIYIQRQRELELERQEISNQQARAQVAIYQAIATAIDRGLPVNSQILTGALSRPVVNTDSLSSIPISTNSQSLSVNLPSSPPHEFPNNSPS